MSDIDLTEAIQAAAEELVRQETAGCCTLGKVCGLCDCFADRDGGAMRDGYARQHARAAINAALPSIGEAFAQAIEAYDSNEALHEAAALVRAQGRGK